MGDALGAPLEMQVHNAEELRAYWSGPEEPYPAHLMPSGAIPTDDTQMSLSFVHTLLRSSLLPFVDVTQGLILLPLLARHPKWPSSA